MEKIRMIRVKIKAVSYKEITGIAFAVFLMEYQLVSYILNRIFPFPHANLIVLLGFMCMIFILYRLRMPGVLFLTAAGILIYFDVSVFYNSSYELFDYAVSFFTVGAAGILLSLIDVKETAVIKACAVFMIGFMLLFNGFELLSEDGFIFGPAVLTGLFCLYIAGMQSLGQKKRIKAVFFLCFFIWFSAAFLNVAGRGSLVAFLSFFILYFLFVCKKRWVHVITVTILLTGVVLLFNIKPVLIFISGILDTCHLHIEAINKTLHKISIGSISSGRDVLLWQVFSGLTPAKLLLGRGIAGYDTAFGIYPHNILLNIFTDYGLLGLSVAGFLIVNFVILFKRRREGKEYLLIFISGCFVPMLFSFVYWWWPGIWYLFGLSMSGAKKYMVKRGTGHAETVYHI